MKEPLGTQLLEAAGEAKTSATLIAPFIKVEAFTSIVEHLASTVALQVVTRWRIDEVASGVSDPGIVHLLTARSNAHLYLHHDLHAKYYRFDSVAYVGSANLTRTALGWRLPPNIELLIPHTPLYDFERNLLACSRPANAALAEEILQAVAELAPPEGSTEPVSEEETSVWIPKTRHPDDLFLVYSGDHERVSTASMHSATTDLEYLAIPSGLGERDFVTMVRAAFRSTHVAYMIDEALHVPRRFGQMRDIVADLAGLGRDEATTAWQTLLRWLLHFYPDEYVRTRPGFSEIVEKQSPLPRRDP